MALQRNTELDYILVNLLNNEPKSKDKPCISQALFHRDQYSNRTDPHLKYRNLFQRSIFNHLGPGVALYFALIKALMIVFLVMTIISIPAMLSNWNGNGLAVYNQKMRQKTTNQVDSSISSNKLSDSLMTLSLANQPMHQYQNINFTQDSTLQQIRFNQSILTITDLLNSVVFIVFVLWFQKHSGEIVSKINHTRPLPSYYTLKVSGLESVPAGSYSEESLANHFSKYGEVSQIGTVYDHQELLIEVRQFMQLVDKFRDANTKEEFKKCYEKLKIKYEAIKIIRPSMNAQQAFVTFETIQTRNRVRGFYQYSINLDSLQYQHSSIDVRKTNIEPVNIIWENYHLKNKKARAGVACVILIVVSVLGLIGLYLVKTHALNSQIYSNFTFDDTLKDQPKYTYQQAVASQNPQIIYAFCSQLTYKDFQWKYYGLCEDYFTSFKQPIISIGLFSLLTFTINFVIYRIIYGLADIKRHKTRPQRQKFLIMSIFMVYFVNNALLILLMKGKIWGTSFHDLIKDFGVDPVSVNHDIQTYDEFNRKWYIDSGRQIIFNFVVSGILTPWLFVFLAAFLSKMKYFLAKSQRSQKLMNQKIKEDQFDFEFFYATTLNTIFFAFLYSTAMPILYPLAALSCLFIFFCSFIIFKHFSAKPQMTDHSLNKIICRFLLVAVLLHQLMSILFVNVDDIFYISYGQKQGNGLFTAHATQKGVHTHSSFLLKLQNGVAFFMVLIAVLILIIFYPKIMEVFQLMNKKKNYLFDPTFSDPLMTFSQCYQINAPKAHKKSVKNLSGSRQLGQKLETLAQTINFQLLQSVVNKDEIEVPKIISSYKMQDNPAYIQLIYALTVINMFSRNQIQLSDQQVIKIKSKFDDLNLSGIFSQRVVFSQVGQYELREKYEFLKKAEGQSD